ncbi:MAG TPA: hypothetical protein VGM82_03455 [Gemmatimonadaceae bacterium]|jgi:hypothetical protein
MVPPSSDPSRSSIAISALRVDRAHAGAATAVFDDDLVTFFVRVAHEDRPMRLRFVAIESVELTDGEVAVALRDGRRVTLVSSEGETLRDELLRRCRTLPELTRTLRAFGSRRGRRSTRETEASEQLRFFAPLMDARRAATKGGENQSSIAAFDVDVLVRAYDETLKAFARERHGDNAPARRALEAELMDLSEPLFAALQSLAMAGAEATYAPDNLRLWRAWSIELRNAFEAADRVWMLLDATLELAPAAQPR